MAGAHDLAGLIRAGRQASRMGMLKLDLGRTEKIFPNGAVPMAVALQYYQRNGVHVTYDAISPHVTNTHFLNPLSATHENMRDFPVTNIVWRYRDDKEASSLCESFIAALEENAYCEQGVIDALNWCLFEVMDNVFQHSHANQGYAMMQIHRQRRWCAVAVSDDGIGIHKSFIENNVHRAHDAYEAIMLAVQEKVTSKAKNMGNGLYGLMRVVGLNKGRLEIRSGRGWLSYKDDRIDGSSSFSWPVLDANGHQGTTVDWQLDLSRPVNLAEALGMKNQVMRIESLEDETGEHRVSVAEFEEGLGTRRSAEQIRMKLTNLLSQGIPRLVLDFTDVNVISSSFADEVLGKMALQMGIVSFMGRFRMEGMSPTVLAIVDRAIQQRIAEGDIGHPGADRG